MSMRMLNGEGWLGDRLREHGVDIFAGASDHAIRRERIRAAIVEKGLAPVIVGRARDGKPLTYSQAFERLYGTPLHVEHNDGGNDACT